MVVLRFDRAAVQRGNARDDKAVFFLFDLSAERAQEIRRALEAVGLLEPQAGGVDDLRLAVRERGDDAQHRDQVRDGRGVDRDTAQRAAPNGDGILRLAHIRAEAARSGDRISELVELLGGDYCRVHLGILQDGLSAETFARLFALSARHEECGREKLEAMLTALQTMADAGELPFSAQETAEAVERWRKDGFPPLHHSEIFRQNYAPAYRVLRRDFARALPLFARIDRLTAERSRVLVAIEGGSASGKTTLGELLQNVYGCPVFHMDDFFLRPEQRTEARFTQPGGNVDRERFLEEVLIPLREGRPVDYRRFDCATFTIAPPQRIEAGTLNIVEGA